MKTQITPLVALVSLVLAGCATSDKLNALHIGMSQPEVVAVLGKPDSKSAQANVEYYTYYLANESANRDQPYFVRFVDGKVESFGRFAQMFDLYNRPVTGAGPSTGYAMPGMTMSPPAVAPAMTPATDLPGQLERLKTLKDRGALTDEEFQRAKNQLLGGAK